MKLNKFLILLLIILFTVLQCSVLKCIQISNLQPDILLILIVFFSLYFGKIYGLIVGLFCGFFSELTSGIPAGPAVLVYSLAGLFLGHIGRWVYNQTIRDELAITFIFTFSVYSALFFLFQAFNANLCLLNTLLFLILPASVYTAVISPLLFRFLKIVVQVK